MFNTLVPAVQLDIANLFTALAWGLGLLLVDKRVHVFASLAIGCFVCLVGYTVASLGAPAWLIVGADIPLDILLLWYVLRKPQKMTIAYPAIWVIYVIFHVLLSRFARYDAMIPGWKLHS